MTIKIYRLCFDSIHYLPECFRNSNGFAAIRPPGHHAAPNEGCGFCIFNNVAICAKKARKLGLKRVLIVDWDVHAGQGTQYCVEDDPGIYLVSMHRYESGHFWPNLPESNAINNCKLFLYNYYNH